MKFLIAIVACGLLAAVGMIGHVFGIGSMIILVIGSTLYIRDSRSCEDRRFRYFTVLLGSLTYLAVFGLIGAMFNN